MYTQIKSKHKMLKVNNRLPWWTKRRKENFLLLAIILFNNYGITKKNFDNLGRERIFTSRYRTRIIPPKAKFALLGVPKSILCIFLQWRGSYLSASRNGSGPPVAVASDHSTTFANPSLRRNSAIFPRGWSTVPMKFWLDVLSSTTYNDRYETQ